MSLRAGQSTQKGTSNMSTREILTGVLALGLALGMSAALSADRPGLGQPVSENELALWDISIGPDGRGLPPGNGTPAQGAVVYAQKCELCHGKEGQGGPNAALSGPQRTVANYVPHATTIFDITRSGNAVAAAQVAYE